MCNILKPLSVLYKVNVIQIVIDKHQLYIHYFKEIRYQSHHLKT